MRQIFLDKGLISLKEVSEPILEPNSILVDVHYSFISSGTEGAAMQMSKKSVFFDSATDKLKKIIDLISQQGVSSASRAVQEKLKGQYQSLGYSVSGKVVAVGSKVRKFRAGDFVACAGSGFANHSDFVCVPENLVVKIKDKKNLRNCSITTLGAIALQGIRRADIKIGETVCIIGLGLLGQITLQLAKLSGCKVVGIDLEDSRLELATKLGADFVINANHAVEKELEFYTNHFGVDCAIVTASSSSEKVINKAINITRKKGRVVIVGDVSINIDRKNFYEKEIDLFISCSYGPGRYDKSYEEQSQDYPYAYVRWTENRNMQAFVDLIEEQKINIEELVSVEFEIESAKSAYDLLNQKKALGAILNYTKNKQLLIDTNETKIIPAKLTQWSKLDKLRVGIIGAGGFAKHKLIPILSKLSDAKLNAVVDTDNSKALNVARFYDVSHTFTKSSELSNSDLVDVCVISTPHIYHCDQTLEALSSGKAVFVEKPLVTDWNQFEKMEQFLKGNSNVPLCVDFNRSFSPYIKKIKDVIAKRHSPLVVLYRMNVGYIPKDNWIQNDIGAGRIIGEACHIFDLFYFLTESKVKSVSVESLHPKSDDIFLTDNFSAQFSFEDGSLCTLIYTSLGHTDLEKERMELFFDGKAIVLDDYKKIKGYGLGPFFGKTSVSQDKGHKAILSEFFDNLKKDCFRPPIPHDRLLEVSKVTLIVDQLACKGGGFKEL
ncbi:bi-domain-containing oxidoreductase [Candidatus Dependentiae bacterium]|nr:bi-domain-containing oxidoreductase [Candidatus Dependentiae bacterium]